MTPQEVSAFFDLVSNTKGYQIKYQKRITMDHRPGLFAAMKYNDVDTFTVSEYFLTNYPDIQIKEVILHEVGHLNHSTELSREEGEYSAQVWALNKARELQDKALEAEVIDRFQDWADQTDTPEYAYAYNKAIKNGIIKPQRYTLCKS